MNNQRLTQILENIKKQKGEKEAEKIARDIAKYHAGTVYYALQAFLTDEDIKEINKIEDEKKAEEEAKKRFAKNTDVTIEELSSYLNEEMANSLENSSQGQTSTTS